METEKLYISDEALQKFGYSEFRGCDYDDYKSIATDDFTELENGLLVSRDNMYNIYIQLSEDDEVFSNIEDVAEAFDN